MKYMVEVELPFNSENDAIAFCNLVEEIKTKITTATFDDVPNDYRCRYHVCYHDEVPAKPCGNYTYVNFKAGKADHKNKAGQKIVYNDLDTTTKTELTP